MCPEYAFCIPNSGMWHLRLCRTFVAFLVCGFIAGAISFGIFNRQHDRGPLDAMALAPAETLKPQKAPSVQKIDSEGTKASSKADWIKPTCREHLGDVLEGDCAPVRVARVRPVRAVNERPLIAAVPIGQRDTPGCLLRDHQPRPVFRRAFLQKSRKPPLP